MSTALLATKFYRPPAGPNLVPRPRLIARLAEGLARGIVLISAPPGFGKTTLVAHLAGLPGLSGVAWLSLDDADNDPTRFWAYFIAALQTWQATVGEEVLPLLQSPQPPPTDALLTALLNHIAEFPDPVALVLEDYHVIQTQPIHEGLAFLLDHRPPHLRLVLTSRADPPLPLARWRARGQLTELRAADLRFTPEEAAEFLNRAMGLSLTAEEIRALEARTEGWIAGLQLAALSMQGRADRRHFVSTFTGSHRYVMSYLVEEVLSRQPENLQTFLLQTSILEQFTASLCSAVTGQPEAQATLERLEQSNLFVTPLDDERRWYRYHPLFAEVLRSQLQRGHAEIVPGLHRRAGEWHERHGQPAEAVAHALAAADYARAAELIEQHALDLLKRGEFVTLLRWVDGLPADEVRSRPRLNVLRAQAQVPLQQLAAAEACLQEAEQTALTLPDALREGLLGEIAAIRVMAVYFGGDLPRTIELARQALRTLPADWLRLRGLINLYLGLASMYGAHPDEAGQALGEAVRLGEAAGDLDTMLYAMQNQGYTQLIQGQLRRAKVTYSRVVQLAAERRLGRMVSLALAHADLAWISYEWNDREEEGQHVEEALAISEQGLPQGLAIGYVEQARLLRVQGDPAGAQDAIQAAEELVHKYKLAPWFADDVTEMQVRLWLAEGNVAAAAAWAQASGLSVEDPVDYPAEAVYFALGRVLVAQGQFVPALRFLDRMQSAAEAAGLMWRVLQILALKTVALVQRGDRAAALAALQQALTLAEPEGYLRTFVDHGEPMRKVIRDWRLEITKRDRDTDRETTDRPIAYVDKLLAAFPGAPSTSAPQSLIANLQSPALVEPLSDRELEILRLVAEGRSSREIAGRLVVAEGTVKKHLNNIYGKLGAHSRTQALARAKELGLL